MKTKKVIVETITGAVYDFKVEWEQQIEVDMKELFGENTESEITSVVFMELNRELAKAKIPLKDLKSIIFGETIIVEEQLRGTAAIQKIEKLMSKGAEVIIDKIEDGKIHAIITL